MLLGGDPSPKAAAVHCQSTFFVTLDWLDRYVPFSENTFLWMDIEGAEYAAILGGRETLRAGEIRWINVEITTEHLRQHQKTEEVVLAELAGLGFQPVLRHHEGGGKYDLLLERTDEQTD